MEVVVLSPKKVRKVGKNGHSITNNITNSLANITDSLTNSITYILVNPSTSGNIPSIPSIPRGARGGNILPPATASRECISPEGGPWGLGPTPDSSDP